MKLRTKQYFNRQKALNNMVKFTDLKSFLMTGFRASRSLVVKKDIINMIIELDKPQMQLAKAS